MERSVGSDPAAMRVGNTDPGHTEQPQGYLEVLDLKEDPPGALQPQFAHLDTSVMYPRGLAFHAAGVAAASATFHFHAGWPYQEVGRGGINLTPRYLVYNRPCFADSWDSFLCEHKKFTLPGEHLLAPQSTQILYIYEWHP